MVLVFSAWMLEQKCTTRVARQRKRSQLENRVESSGYWKESDSIAVVAWLKDGHWLIIKDCKKNLPQISKSSLGLKKEATGSMICMIHFTYICFDWSSFDNESISLMRLAQTSVCFEHGFLEGHPHWFERWCERRRLSAATHWASLLLKWHHARAPWGWWWHHQHLNAKKT